MTRIALREYGFMAVKDNRFEVGLRFRRGHTRLVVPFAAVKAMWDDGERKCGDA